MIRKLEEVFNADTFVGYAEELAPDFVEGVEFLEYFPVKTVDGLDYSYIKTANSAIELTAPSAFDAEPISQHREGFDAMKGELPLFRRKMVLSEKEKATLKMYIQANNVEGINRLLTQIYDDQTTLIKGAVMTQEFLRAKALMDGKITINSKGGAVSVDYKVPAENKITLTGDEVWTNTDAKIIDKIVAECDRIEEKTGTRPTRMVMNKTTFKLLRDNLQIRQNMLPLGVMASATVQQGVVLSDQQVMATLQALTGLTAIHVYNKKVQMDGEVYDLVENYKVAIVPEGKLGETMIGTSPAELNMAEANASGAGIRVMGEGLAVNVYTNVKAPYTSGTEIEFVGLPSLVASDKVLLFTVA